MPTGAAELVDDRGAAAQGPEFFRSRAFLDAEGATHTVRIESGDYTASLPVIVREIPGHDERDAVSPYGYPGALVRGPADAAPDPGEIDWSATGLVSLFVRDRVGGAPCLAHPTARSLVQVHDPGSTPSLRSRFGEQIRRNARLGWRVETIPGPRSSSDERSEFIRAYTETMSRAEAAERYFFADAYFDAVLGFERSWLLLARAPQREAAAGAIAAVSDGFLHYFLGGTVGAHLGASPFKNVVAAMVELSDQLGLPLNLGGGVRPGDGLENFKRGFANSELPFHSHEVVCDRRAYARLGGDSRGTDFFPAYRAPAAP